MNDRDGGSGPALTLADLANLVGGTVRGDGTLRLAGVAPVDEASSEQLGFLALKRYARYVADSGAGAFLVSADMVEHVPEGQTCLVVEDAYPALGALLKHFHPDEVVEPGVHATAILGQDVELGEGVHVGPYAVLEQGVSVGDRAVIEAHSVVGRNSSIGPRTRLHPHVVVYHGSRIGADVIVHSGARIGSDGFGYTFVDGAHRKMPQVGRAVIEDGVEIGANTTVDRGSLGDTVLGRGVKVDNLVQIAHNVKVGAQTLIAALVGIAGSTRIGRGVWLGGRAGVINQLEVGDGARIAVCSVVMRDVPAGVTVSGHPARPHREEMRKKAQLGRLPAAIERVEERVQRLEEEFERLSGER